MFQSREYANSPWWLHSPWWPWVTGKERSGDPEPPCPAVLPPHRPAAVDPAGGIGRLRALRRHYQAQGKSGIRLQVVEHRSKDDGDRHRQPVPGREGYPSTIGSGLLDDAHDLLAGCVPPEEILGPDRPLQIGPVVHVLANDPVEAGLDQQFRLTDGEADDIRQGQVGERRARQGLHVDHAQQQGTAGRGRETQRRTFHRSARPGPDTGITWGSALRGMCGSRGVSSAVGRGSTTGRCGGAGPRRPGVFGQGSGPRGLGPWARLSGSGRWRGGHGLSLNTVIGSPRRLISR